jgi:hypothetical protein
VARLFEGSNLSENRAEAALSIYRSCPSLGEPQRQEWADRSTLTQQQQQLDQSSQAHGTPAAGQRPGRARAANR